MDIRQQAIKEYLVDGMTYQQLSQKYGVSRSTINKWVLVSRFKSGGLKAAYKGLWQYGGATNILSTFCYYQLHIPLNDTDEQ